jgi:hypothetical protein
MGRKLSGVYEVLIQGLCRELSGHDLYKFVTERCKASSHKRICKASLLAMSDTRVADATHWKRSTLLQHTTASTVPDDAIDFQ